jgi:hypothetical protein
VSIVCQVCKTETSKNYKWSVEIHCQHRRLHANAAARDVPVSILPSNYLNRLISDGLFLTNEGG